MGASGLWILILSIIRKGVQFQGSCNILERRKLHLLQEVIVIVTILLFTTNHWAYSQLHYVAVPIGSLQFNPGSAFTLRVLCTQWDLKPESYRICPIFSHFDQHMRDKQSSVPNGFNLIVQLHLHQKWDRSRSIQFNGVCRLCLEQFSSCLHYEITRTELNRFDPEHLCKWADRHRPTTWVTN